MNDRLSRGEEEAVLGRRTRALLSASDVRRFRGQRVLITGAGGSIGSALVERMADCRPERLTLVDASELNLFRLERFARARWPLLPIDIVLGDVTRPRFMLQTCSRTRPDVVYHAAAYKHVTMAERAPCAAALTNVAGTVNALRAARAVAARFVLISTDKAARPTGVMGATKWMAEAVTQSSAALQCRAIAVRFGNVLQSSGSLSTIVGECVRARTAVPLTHPDATRYFMTSDEAASLVMKADLIGDHGNLLWLDMGTPVRVRDVIDRLLEVAVRQGWRRVPIRIVGLRPGEKLHEELSVDRLARCRRIDRHIHLAEPASLDRARVLRATSALKRYALAGDAASVLLILSGLVPGFNPSAETWGSAAESKLILMETRQAIA